MKSFRKLWSLGMVLLVMGFVVLGGARESRGHLISVVKGNKPVENMGWPLGTTNITNLKSRLGYIEGPPFGGGMYEFFYRCGNTAEFNEILKSFAAIRAPEVELVVHDGPEHVFWFEGDMNKRIPQPETRIDWKFLAWVPYNWHRLNNSPKSYVMSDNPDFRKPVPGPRRWLGVSTRA